MCYGCVTVSNSQAKQFRRNVNKFSKNQLSTKFTMYNCNRSDFWEILLSVAEAMQMEAGKYFSWTRHLSTKFTTQIVYVYSYLYSSAKTCEVFLCNLYVFICVYICIYRKYHFYLRQHLRIFVSQQRRRELVHVCICICICICIYTNM